MRESTWQTATNVGRKVNYYEAVRTEVGAVQTDDFKIGTLTSRQATLRSKFANDAFIKIWRCNSGVRNWVYSDNGVVDPADTFEAYYWRAFNSQNTPKPSIAKALSTFFNVKVYGAKSGASIEVKYNRAWVSSQQYKNTVGHWPSGNLPHRLMPDTGPYHEFTP
jgi:hypothetical protein